MTLARHHVDLVDNEGLLWHDIPTMNSP